MDGNIWTTGPACHSNHQARQRNNFRWHTEAGRSHRLFFRHLRSKVAGVAYQGVKSSERGWLEPGRGGWKALCGWNADVRDGERCCRRTVRNFLSVVVFKTVVYILNSTSLSTATESSSSDSVHGRAICRNAHQGANMDDTCSPPLQQF